MNRIFLITVLVACVSATVAEVVGVTFHHSKSGEVAERGTKVQSSKTQSSNRWKYKTEIYSEEDDEEGDHSYDKGTAKFEMKIAKPRDREKIVRRIETVGSSVYLTTKKGGFKRIKYIGSENSD